MTQPSRLSHLFWLGYFATVVVLAFTRHSRACCLLCAVYFAYSVIFSLLRPTTLLTRIVAATAFGVLGAVCALFAAGIKVNPAATFVACWLGVQLFFAAVSLDPTLKKDRESNF